MQATSSASSQANSGVNANSGENPVSQATRTEPKPVRVQQLRPKNPLPQGPYPIDGYDPHYDHRSYPCMEEEYDTVNNCTLS